MTELDDILTHYGVPGMKWGVRKAPRRSSSGPTTVILKSKPGAKIKTSGGKNHPASADATRAAIMRQMAKKSTVSSLSNKELQELVTRLNLERQYGQLTTNKLGKSFVSKLLVDVGTRKASKIVGDAAEDAFKKKSKGG